MGWVFIPKRRASVELFPTYLRLIPAHLHFSLWDGGGGLIFWHNALRCEDRAVWCFVQKPAERKKTGRGEGVGSCCCCKYRANLRCIHITHETHTCLSAVLRFSRAKEGRIGAANTRTPVLTKHSRIAFPTSCTPNLDPDVPYLPHHVSPGEARPGQQIAAATFRSRA
jgi:hypothetical protein